MDFGAIIGFIVIVFISSLFNKNKNPAKPTTKTRPMPSQIPEKKPSSQKENRTKKLSNGLEDLFKEIKVEYDKKIGDTQEGKKDLYPEQDSLSKYSAKTNQSIKGSKYTLKNNIRKVKGSVYEGEIGKEESLNFSKESVVQGIIMSEILQKPKSLRR